MTGVVWELGHVEFVIGRDFDRVATDSGVGANAELSLDIVIGASGAVTGELAGVDTMSFCGNSAGVRNSGGIDAIGVDAKASGITNDCRADAVFIF